MNLEEHANEEHMRTRSTSKKNEGSFVSIIVPTYNSSRTIGQCLESVGKQTYRNIETIVCDNFSHDDTVDIARRYKTRIVFRGRERAAQKNFGAEHARGDVLYFIDSDFVLERDAVQRCVQFIQNADAIVTVNRSCGEGLWARSIAYKRELLADDESVIAARFIRKKIFFEVGGFDEKLVVGEDIDLHRRLVEAGFRIKRVNAVEWHMGEPRTFRELVLRAYYYARNIRRYLEKNKRGIVGHLNPFKIALIEGLLKKPSLLIISLTIIQITTYMTSLLGLLTAKKTSTTRSISHHTLERR